jgi:hypothetical protein
MRAVWEFSDSAILRLMRHARAFGEFATERRDAEYYPMWAGQGIGVIRDLPAAADVMAALVRESGEAFASMSARVRN